MTPESEPSPWIVEPLGKHHDRAAFSSGNHTLDRYLKQQAGLDARRRIAAPFVLVSKDNRKIIIGYYTLSSFGIDLEELPEDVAKKLPSYPIVPVILLGRLAVDRRHRGQGIGEFLLMDALHRAFIQSSQVAATAVVVDAIDDQARRFYQHFGFIVFPDRPSRLFLPMKTIADIFHNA